jgi:hypothetical protein
MFAIEGVSNGVKLTTGEFQVERNVKILRLMTKFEVSILTLFLDDA